MIDLIALSAAKKHAELLAMGLISVSVNNTNKSITFTLAADGSQHTIYFDQPSDGVSIIGVEIKNGHLICLMSDGSEIDAGVLPSGGSGGYVPKPLTYDYMPEGYPSKSGWSIEWDGNTEGLVVVDEVYFKVSDSVLTYDEFIGSIFELSDGFTAEIISDNTISSEDITSTDYVIVVKKDNVTVDGLTFPQKGIYFANENGQFYVTKLSKQTITPMAEEFVPDDYINGLIDAKLGVIENGSY